MARRTSGNALEIGADAIGLNFYPPSPRFLSLEWARQLASEVPPFVTTVALFVNPPAAEVYTVLERVRPAMLQFHGEESSEFCAQFRLPYIKAVKVRAGVDLLQCERLYAAAKGLLLDAYVDGSQGGTGTSFDWALIPARFSRPPILAGGLSPENVGDAIRRVRPWAVDVSSGVESGAGIKDPAKIAEFMRGVRNADV